MNYNDEAEEKRRVEALINQQIEGRHPGDSKIRHYDWQKHAARPQPKKVPFYIEWYTVMGRRFQGALMGLLLGLCVTVLLVAYVLPPAWSLLGILPILTFGIVGWVLGAVLQD